MNRNWGTNKYESRYSVGANKQLEQKITIKKTTTNHLSFMIRVKIKIGIIEGSNCK